MNQAEDSYLLGEHRPDLIREESLPDLLKPSFELYSDNTALCFKDTTLSYRDLDLYSDYVGEYLRQQGVKPGDRVGIWYPRALELPILILGILKSGACYIPFDIDMPKERVLTAMNEAGATLLYTKETIDFPTIVIKDLLAVSPEQIQAKSIQISPEQYAYIIFTSGSTGKPKGIPIQHQQIAHLIRSEQEVLQIKSSDRVYQGFSVSFDMWCEEVWISLFAGATIWMADAETAKSIDTLSDQLREASITVLHAVPSLLSVIDANVPSIRLVNSGGEACNTKALTKWATKDRIFFNSYGPTETTVSATFGILTASDKIHIGKPLPNYHLAVVDEQFNVVKKGIPGELVISCPGTSIGYLNRPDLTKEKFITKPGTLAKLPGDRIYRTGDAVVMQEDNTLSFQGRIDEQIKLRGYRIELDEINTHLQKLPHVAASAITVFKNTVEQDVLVAYVVLDDPSLNWNEHDMKQVLMEFMPLYMIPTYIEILREMPRLPSGKIDKKSLPKPIALTHKINTENKKPDNDASVSEKTIYVLKDIFQTETIDITKDFFNDLGGHSMMAAIFVSRLREDFHCEQVSVKDVYTFKPINQLLDHWEKEHNTAGEKQVKPPFHQSTFASYYWCWIVQSLLLLLIYGLFALSMFFPFLNYYYIQVETENHLYAALGALLSYFILPPLVTAISVGLKWLVIGKFKEGDYPLWGNFYIRWWFVKTLENINHIELLSSTPLYNIYLRWIGVNVHATAQISYISIGAEDLLTIEEDASVSSYVHFNNAWVENGLLKLRKIHIGKHTAIGTNAVVSGNTIIKDWGELKDLSHLQEGQVIEDGEIWNGSPAKCIDLIPNSKKVAPEPIPKNVTSYYHFVFGALMAFFPIQFLVPLLPSIYIFNELDNAAPDYNFEYFVLAPIVSCFYILIYILFSSLLIRALQRNMPAGNYSVYSWIYVKKWLSDQIYSLTLTIIHPIFASVYISPVFRLMGARVGKNTEISTASNVTHSMLTIGDESFIADAVALGESEVRHQQLILDHTSIGNKSFVGNSALIPQGYHLTNNTLIGVLSTPPDAAAIEKMPDADWFGSPAIAMTKRQVSEEYKKNELYDPTKLTRFYRSIVEFLRILFPQSVLFCGTILFVAYAHDLVSQEPIYNILLKLPFYYLFFIGFPVLILPIILKWLLIGKYKSQHLPMWTNKVWRSEAVTTTTEALAVPYLLEFLKGTAWLPVIFRLYGTKIGKRVWMNTVDITEYDLVSIGDYCELNHESGPQTHLFEDRVMKMGMIHFDAKVSIGSRSIILYDAHIGTETTIKALSLVMKSESISARTRWIGSPIEPFKEVR